MNFSGKTLKRDPEFLILEPQNGVFRCRWHCRRHEDELGLVIDGTVEVLAGQLKVAVAESLGDRVSETVTSNECHPFWLHLNMQRYFSQLGSGNQQVEPSTQSI